MTRLMARRIGMVVAAMSLTLGMISGPALARGPGHGFARAHAHGLAQGQAWDTGTDRQARDWIGEGAELVCWRGRTSATIVPQGRNFRMTGPEGRSAVVRLGTERRHDLVCSAFPLEESRFIYFRVPPGQLTWVAPTRRELYDRIAP
jgi:hypothetical protein